LGESLWWPPLLLNRKQNGIPVVNQQEAGKGVATPDRDLHMDCSSDHAAGAAAGDPQHTPIFHLVYGDNQKSVDSRGQIGYEKQQPNDQESP